MSVPDLDRLQYAVANFKQLQGLRMAAVGVFILIVFFPWRRPGDLTISGILLLPGIAGLIFALKRIGAWYEARFGHVEVKSPGVWQTVLAVSCLGVLPWLLHPGSLKSVPEYMKGFTFQWWMGWFFVGVAMVDRRRWYYLPFGLLFCILSFLKTHGVELKAINGGLDGLFTIVLGVAYIATGLADHFYLLHTLPGLGDERHA